ncbi:hypothetical protein K456DRAFT_1723346 [Colletotrichum gloeosporioides 23]|nr:hypothetical protein K456DRAFT_1723346 [Colletotrichum gloeosporioides 23]
MTPQAGMAAALHWLYPSSQPLLVGLFLVSMEPEIFSKDAQLQFTKNPALQGIEEIQQSFVPAFGTLLYMKHVPMNFVKLDLSSGCTFCILEIGSHSPLGEVCAFE